jgi:hypothetical protein
MIVGICMIQLMGIHLVVNHNLREESGSTHAKVTSSPFLIQLKISETLLRNILNSISKSMREVIRIQ